MDPYIGEIRLFANTNVPQGWLACEGQDLAIKDYTALFGVIGFLYGGDQRNFFAVPNLQGASAMGAGSGPGLTPRTVAQSGGVATITLQSTELASHSHVANSSPTSTASAVATNNVWANGIAGKGRQPQQNLYIAAPDTNTFMNAAAVANTGGGGAHANVQPALVLRYCIATTGVFPSRQ